MRSIAEIRRFLFREPVAVTIKGRKRFESNVPQLLPDHKTDFSKGVSGANDGDLWNASVLKKVVSHDELHIAHSIQNVKRPVSVDLVYLESTIKNDEITHFFLVPFDGRAIHLPPNSIVAWGKKRHLLEEEVRDIVIKGQPWTL